MLLLDEPLAAVDVGAASQLRQLLRDRLVQSGTATILVTHDVLDALVVADRVAILQEGRIVETGPTQRVLGAPRTRFIAALAGVNLVTGVLGRDGSLRTARRAAIFRPVPRCPTGDGCRDVRGFPTGGSALRRWEVSSRTPGTPTSRRWSRHPVASAWLAGDPDIVAEVSPLDVAEQALVVGSVVRLSVAEADVVLHAR